MKIIVGLGNPGKKYNITRHNVGFMALDAYAKELGLVWELNKKFKAEVIGYADMLLVKPQTFMNLSGDTVQSILHFYNKRPLDKGGWGDSLQNELIVIHDDLDIDLGKIKISIDSRAAGHNGVQSIIDRLATKNFTRIRVGIRTEMSAVIPAEKFVLEKFKKEELETINKLIPEIIQKIK